jgi:hypothetical protein
MSRPTRRHAQRNAGAFLGPDLLVPVPMRTLDEHYRDPTPEREGSEREPEPEPPGFVHRLLVRLRPPSRRGR